MKNMCVSRLGLAIGCLLFTVSCTNTPTKLFDQFATSAGLSKTTIKSEPFSTVSFSELKTSKLQTKPILHIYLGGDGSPWITPNYRSTDPTPRKKTALKLMLLDPAPSIYLGRPCYHQPSPEDNCSSKWWTSHRYSDEVVDSMAHAIKLISGPNQQLRLIGFSGGGSLAMLLAARLDAVSTLISVSANLDTDYWTDQHNYTPLYGSANPLREPPLDSNIKQIHLLGAQDHNVDSNYLFNQLNGRPSTKVHLLTDFDHHCCWTEYWPDFIRQFSVEVKTHKPGD